MIADVRAMLWKEWRELFLGRSSRRSALLVVVLPLAVLGVYLPAEAGRDWLTSPPTLVAWAWLPLFLVGNVIADSFVGERERHTLETLLASRLSDRAILAGKVCAAVGYAWGLTLAMLVLGIATVNVMHGSGELLLYPPGMAIAAVTLSLLGALLAAGIGILVSLAASSARQAQQAFGIGVMAVVFVPVLGAQILPDEWKARLAAAFATADTAVIVAVVVAVLTVLDAALLAAAAARFRREKLVVD